MRCLVIALVLVSDVCRAEEDVLKAATDAARAREERLKTFSIEWKTTSTVDMSGFAGLIPAGHPGHLLPQLGETVEYKHRLVLDGRCYRFERIDAGTRDRIPSMGDGVEVYDGLRTYRRLHLNGIDKPATLFCGSRTSDPELGFVPPQAIRLWCRPLGTMPLGNPTEKPVVKDSIEVTSAGEFWEFRLRDKRRMARAYLLDARSGYLTRRIQWDHERTLELTQIEYGEDQSAGWAPRAWTVTTTRTGGELVQRLQAEVTLLVVDKPVPPTTFQIQPVPGELVRDDETNQTFVVDPDGTLIEIDPTTGLRLPSEPAPRSIDWPALKVLRIVVVAGLLAIVLVALFLRRRGRVAHTPTP